MSSKNELIGYALDFVSYLINHSADTDVERVILFGSIARGDFDEESDIDLFIDTSNTNLKKMEKKISRLRDDYLKTEKAKNWKLKGITNPFSCLVGKLDSKAWADLKRGMMNNAYVLFGRYKATAEKIYHHTLFSFGPIKPESKRVSFHRRLFGFQKGKKRYPGLAEKYGILKLGTGSLLVPLEQALIVKELFRKQKVAVRVYDVWGDAAFN